MLGLLEPTAPRWVENATRELDLVLRDHAHCEMKAASNALALSARSAPWPRVVRALVCLAEEELSHLRRVLEELDRRGLALGFPEEDHYAAELRRRASASRADKDVATVVADRLLVGAVIEARSCERFRLLRDALAARSHELAPFYDELFACEARHYTELADLAEHVSGDPDRVRARLAALFAIERDIVGTLPGAPAIHG